MIHIKTYPKPPFCEKEILRYAGSKTPTGDVKALLETCKEEVRGVFSYRVAYRELAVSDLEGFTLSSKDLQKNLSGAKTVILFAATVGLELDRLITKYGRISPSKALMLQAIGAERIEALCDAFCEDIAGEKGLFPMPRFSPGYGDLPVTMQKEVFALLDCSRKIGVYLNDSMLMSPSKSVTAFLGLCETKTTKDFNKCSRCNKTDCLMRGAL